MWRATSRAKISSAMNSNGNSLPSLLSSSFIRAVQRLRGDRRVGSLRSGWHRRRRGERRGTDRRAASTSRTRHQTARTRETTPTGRRTERGERGRRTATRQESTERRGDRHGRRRVRSVHQESRRHARTQDRRLGANARPSERSDSTSEEVPSHFQIAFVRLEQADLPRIAPSSRSGTETIDHHRLRTSDVRGRSLGLLSSRCSRAELEDLSRRPDRTLLRTLSQPSSDREGTLRARQQLSAERQHSRPPSGTSEQTDRNQRRGHHLHGCLAAAQHHQVQLSEVWIHPRTLRPESRERNTTGFVS